MIRFENTRSTLSISNNVQQVVCDLQVSTASELPSKDTPVGGRLICPGSIAQVIQVGKFYTMDADGTWYDSDGETPASVSESVNSTRTLDTPTLTKTAVIDEPKAEITEPDAEPETDETEESEPEEPEVTEDER
jgi:hypothetical protein